MNSPRSRRFTPACREVETASSTGQSMLADVTHEMRTPLAIIDAHLESVEDGIRTRHDDSLAVIRWSTGQLRRVTEDMATVSRTEGELDQALADT